MERPFEGSLNLIALEYVPGRTLDQVLQDEGPPERSERRIPCLKTSERH